MAADQGAIITVNGGKTFSSWYNQPTAQFYHVSTDNEFPYNVYGGQQESGSVGIASRGNDGVVGFREWHPVGVEEYGYVAADPLNPNIIYGGKITRYDKRTGQVQNIAPEAVRSGKYRFLRTAPVLFSPVDKKTLYFAGNVLFKTTNGGNSWQVISPDLSRESWDIPESVGIYTTEDMKKMPRRGVIYTVAPSFKDINTIWVGTDDGLIHVTRDGGKTWKNVTPPQLTSWSKVSLMEASHYDVNTAYAAVNRIRCDDMRPHIYKTNDGGKTWKEIVNGLPDDPINAVREDPRRKGLLYAGSERAVYVSFDDGENWQTLRLNMPATSIRDLVIKDDDIVVGTHGRSFWILDDISLLRQLDNNSRNQAAILFKPQLATRVRWNQNTDTPIPQEEPSGQNPPDGAIINYYLKEKVAGDLILEIQDALTGKLIRRYTNQDKPFAIPAINVPMYWIRPQEILSAEPGTHRFLWDIKYEPLDIPPSYPISATFMNTEPNPTSPWVMPGNYRVKLIVDGKSHTQTLQVRMDPRIKTPVSELRKQHDLSVAAYEARIKCMATLKSIGQMRQQIKELLSNSNSNVSERLKQIDQQLGQLENPGANSNAFGFTRVNAGYASVFNILQDTEMPPTSQAVQAMADLNKRMAELNSKWETLRKTEISKLNQELKDAGLRSLGNQ